MCYIKFVDITSRLTGTAPGVQASRMIWSNFWSNSALSGAKRAQKRLDFCIFMPHYCTN